MVLNESCREALGNRSEIVRILALAMTATADDGVGGSNSV